MALIASPDFASILEVSVSTPKAIQFDVGDFEQSAEKYFADSIFPVYNLIFKNKNDHNNPNLENHIDALLSAHKKVFFCIIDTATNTAHSKQISAFSTRTWLLSLIMDDVLDNHLSRMGIDSFWLTCGKLKTIQIVWNEIDYICTELDNLIDHSGKSLRKFIKRAIESIEQQKSLSLNCELNDLLGLYFDRIAFIGVWPFYIQETSQSMQLVSGLLAVAGQIHNDLKDYTLRNIDGSQGVVNVPRWFEHQSNKESGVVKSSSLLGLRLLERAYSIVSSESLPTFSDNSISWRYKKLQNWLKVTNNHL